MAKHTIAAVINKSNLLTEKVVCLDANFKNLNERTAEFEELSDKKILSKQLKAVENTINLNQSKDENINKTLKTKATYGQLNTLENEIIIVL